MNIQDRFKGFPFVTPIADHEVTVVGAGGIGSYLIPHLARLNPLYIAIYDFDTIEEHNVGTQLFSIHSVGHRKNETAKAISASYADYSNCITYEEFVEESNVTKIMFSAVDNMAARKLMFEQWVKYNSNEPDAIFIDGRIGAMSVDVFCVSNLYPETIAKYRKWLFDDADFPDNGCTTKSTSHIGMLCASLMIQTYINIVQHQIDQEFGSLHEALFHQKIDGQTWKRIVHL